MKIYLSCPLNIKIRFEVNHMITPICKLGAKQGFFKTRPDTRLPQSRAGGQGPYLRALEDLGKSSEDKDHKNIKKFKCDRWTDRQMDQQTDQQSGV